MVNKRIPDWLNNSMWSSSPTNSSPPPKSQSSPPQSPSHDDRIASHPSKPPSVTSSDSSVNERRESLPSPSSMRPESPSKPGPAPRTEVRDPLASSGSSDNDGSSPVEDVSRQAQLLQELSRKIINMGELQRLASQGIPDGAGLRSTVWKLLLAYLPVDKGLWSSELARKRSQYKLFKEDLLKNPSEVTRELEESTSSQNGERTRDGEGLLSRSEIPEGEHPLSLGKTSIWNQFFQDTEIIEQIDRDVKRTHPDMHFFSGDSASAKANQVNAEADTFFCFVELLSGFRDNFCKQLDNSVVGIRSTISKMSQLLKEHDEELWRHLELTTKVNPQFYAFRWITLLLTQEFNFADILHIWDTLLSDQEGPQETLLRICCAMLILVRRRLLAGDFTANLKLLQSYPSTNISHLLYVANKLRSHSTA
ncbi:TBC1 domain family member 13-like isoform X2 [Cynara cardunculus var. scolymus]|uniref:TBC1 domain family member 13-like isoform X2 n=1 Tax=Cynara cardunculus var. scolymus TaxID=59895 RepID=UPI000D63064E|nr:TBC1 domain family member 13-like isoform X2 [Cynara cardunculus var. scolymus]